MHFRQVKRPEFTTLLGGAAAWLLAARAQQGERVRRIGWLIGRAESDPESQAGRAAFQEALVKLGWIEGRNLRIDVRFAADDPNHIRAYAMELVELAPDVIVTGAAVVTRAVQQQTRTIPIVFIGGGDPAAIGLVRNIAQPEGNAPASAVPKDVPAARRRGDRVGRMPLVAMRYAPFGTLQRSARTGQHGRKRREADNGAIWSSGRCGVTSEQPRAHEKTGTVSFRRSARQPLESFRPDGSD